jgi:hypothetical protein
MIVCILSNQIQLNNNNNKYTKYKYQQIINNKNNKKGLGAIRGRRSTSPCRGRRRPPP